MSLLAQKSRPEMVATIYGNSQAQLSERLGMICAARRGVYCGRKKARSKSGSICLNMGDELLQALGSDVFLQRSQGCLVIDDSGPDTENVSSSNWREFDGGIIAHAGGAGGFG